MNENTTPEISHDELIQQRYTKLTKWREQGHAFPNDFHRDALAADLHHKFGHLENEALQATKNYVAVAGRIMLHRTMGKASFIQLQDMTGQIQLYLRKDDLPDGTYDEVKQWDLGDIVGAEGYLFKTKTGELSVHLTGIRLLTKSLLPLPDKFHGLSDKELRYRQRYVDLIANEETRKIFLTRSKLIHHLRDFFLSHGFLEVETPMLQVLAGGATARPFATHHNTLNLPMYLRIAPELYLKRLVVGGFEKVFELNRNFRNEGISIKHNPEFTMLEFYQAFANYRDLIKFTEELLITLALQLTGKTVVEYQGMHLDFGKPFAKMTMKEAILKYNQHIKKDDLEDITKIKALAMKLGLEVKNNYGLGKLQMILFEGTVESQLIEPTFITEYPAEVSPLARRNDDNPFITDRFELFIAGRELANGFSELNDPEDQAERFRQQAKDKETGDEEAMAYDEDYITALQYGMPPTAGEGIGIDRLVMLFTDSASIRDVILFPHLRPKK